MSSQPLHPTTSWNRSFLESSCSWPSLNSLLFWTDITSSLSSLFFLLKMGVDALVDTWLIPQKTADSLGRHKAALREILNVLHRSLSGVRRQTTSSQCCWWVLFDCWLVHRYKRAPPSYRRASSLWFVCRTQAKREEHQSKTKLKLDKKSIERR